MSQEENRRAARVARHVMARYRTTRVPEAAWLMSPLRDLSGGGARFLSEYAFEAGELMELQLLLPNAPKPIELKAKVAWMKPMPTRFTELGVTFDPGDTAVQRVIDEAIVRFLRQASKE